MTSTSHIPKVYLKYAQCPHCKAQTIFEGKEETCIMCGRAMNPPQDTPLPLIHYSSKGMPREIRLARPYSMATRQRGRPRKDRTPAYIIEERIKAVNAKPLQSEVAS